MAPRTAPTNVEPWDRRRLLATLAGVVVAVLLLVTGLGLAIYYAVMADSSAQSEDGASRERTVDPDETGRQRRDQIAAKPMLEVPAEAAQRGMPSATPGKEIAIPTATTTGPVGVASGYPKTPEGAAGQLAAIEIDVMQGMSIPHANEVYKKWALPGGAGAKGWPLTKNIQAFLGSAGQAANSTVTVTTTPAAAQIKGKDGPQWVLACVLLDVRAVVVTEARMAYGYCERMQRVDDRWMIAPGASPAKAPSTWSGTDLAEDAGWRTWVEKD